MKKYAIVFGAMLIANVAFGFGGPGTDRQGNVVDTTLSVSRPAVTIKGCGIGASRRENLWNIKCDVRASRMSTRIGNSQILSGTTYRASTEMRNTPQHRVENWLELARRIMREKRAANKAINSN